jgi:hypothetical protein
MSQRRDQEELSHLEALLRSLKPQTGMSRDGMLFRAGQNSVRHRPKRLVPVALALLGMVVGIWVGRTFFQTTSPVEKQVVIVHVKDNPTPQPEPQPQQPPQVTPRETQPAPPAQTTASEKWPPLPGRDGYLGLRDQVLRWGVEILPSSPVRVDGPGDQPSSSLLEWQSKLTDKSWEF